MSAVDRSHPRSNVDQAGIKDKNNLFAGGKENAPVVNEALALLGQQGTRRLGVAVTPLDYEEANGDKPQPPLPQRKPEKSSFDVPYDKERAAELIKQLGSGKFPDRQTASDQLKRMGPKVIPQLQETLSSKDNEIKTRGENAIGFINDRHIKEQYDRAMNALYDSLPGWEDLLHRGGATMVGNDRILKLTDNVPQMPAFIGADGKVQEMDGTLLATGGRKGTPTKEEQQKIDALLKKLDGIDTNSPEFQKKLNDARKLARDPQATYEQKVEFLKLSWLERAKHEGRELYVNALGMSQDKADLAKGGAVFMTELTKSNGMFSEHRCQELAINAVRFGLHNDEKFKKEFFARGGTPAQLKEVQDRLKIRK